tara:strand:+ start:16609 stop:17784 length:1176 start_codon:yes stop_codon:yes gene_type:complete
MENLNSSFEILTSTKPSKYKYALYRWLFVLLGPLFRFLLSRLFLGIEVVGKENLRGGPYLVLMNHSCALDPLLVNFFGERPLQFLISESFMRPRLVSKVISLFGHVAKRKLDLDPGSIQLLKRWSDCGAHIALFPEGVFSLYGEPSPLMPGIDQLIRFLNLPVVIVHLSNGDRVKPLWATAMRKTKIKITIHPAQTFRKEDPILSIITEKLFSLDKPNTKFASYCAHTAQGLAKTLVYCPTCSQDNSLVENGYKLNCNRCRDVWEIGADNTVIHSKDKKVKDLFIKSFETTTSKWLRQKEIRSTHSIQPYDISKGSWIAQIPDLLILGADSLTIGSLSIPYSDIQSHTQDWGEVIILKTKTNRWALEITQDSRAQFVNLLEFILSQRKSHA